MEEVVALLKQVYEFVIQFKDLAKTEQLSGIVLLIIALWKSSILKPYWEKVGAAKVLVAPVLAVVLGFVYLNPFSWENVWLSLKSGLLAIAFHRLTLALKETPFIGDKYKAVVDFFEKLLRKPAKDAEDAGVKDPTV